MEVDNEQTKIRNYLTATTIGDHHTDVGVFQFENQLFVILTQFEKIGTMVLITPAKSISNSSNPVYHIKILFGKDEVEVYAFARFLAEKLTISQPLLLGLALKNNKDNSALLIQKAVDIIADGVRRISIVSNK